MGVVEYTEMMPSNVVNGGDKEDSITKQADCSGCPFVGVEEYIPKLVTVEITVVPKCLSVHSRIVKPINESGNDDYIR